MSYAEGKQSSDCDHAKQSPFPHTKEDGTTETRVGCPSCGMEWGSGHKC